MSQNAIDVRFTVLLCVGLAGVGGEQSLAAPPAVAPVPSVADALKRTLIDPALPLQETQNFIDERIPMLPKVSNVAEWEQHAARMRQEALDRVVFRGEAAKWRLLPTRVEWLATLPGGPGYTIKKLRYEAVPGMWIPALLYEPDKLSGKVPVSLAVNGHDRKGKAVDYKQLRCINQAKRGMIVLNVEWLGMGQLSLPGFLHYNMNQLDLCGTSGLAPFYLSMSRGLDILLAHEHADPARVAVQGLSGGGWQTIFISSLDTRVTLCNPVAGYSSLRTRVRHFSDLGDSEQNPVDLETVTDYAQMTAMLAPRPALLTYNVADNCCFRADHALPPLVAAAQPIYDLYKKSNHLRTHVNHSPGDHNYGLDNRQQFYGMLKDFFFASHAEIKAEEIPSEQELKTPEQLEIPLPADNADFNAVARKLMQSLPHDPVVPADAGEKAQWQTRRREELRGILHAKPGDVRPILVDHRPLGKFVEKDWWLRIDGNWTVPAVEISPENPQGDTIVIADGGRAAATKEIEALLAAGRRVIAVDPFYFGESKITQRDMLFAIAVSSVGERPLGIQTGQLAGVGHWRKSVSGSAPQIVAHGPRSSLMALCAAAIDGEAITAVELHGGYSSLKQVIERGESVDKAPELFCFGLLERFDIPQLVGLVEPRPVTKPGH